MAKHYSRDDDDDRPRRRRDERDDDDYDDEPRRRRAPAKKGMGLGMILGIVLGVLLLCVALPIGLLLPATQKVRMASARMKDQNNLKQITIGVHNQSDSTMDFATGPGVKNPLTQKENTELSFRVGLLPYIEQSYLEKQFRKDEPWDSPANRPLANTVVTTYTSPLDPAGTATTRYRGFVGPKSVFEPGTRVTLASITDGTSNTIYVVSADDGVVWSKPDELNFTATGPLPTIGQKSFPGGTNVALCDGSIRFLSNKTSETVLRALITRNGNEELPPDW